MIAWKDFITQSGFVGKSVTERWRQDIGPKDPTIPQNEIVMGSAFNTDDNIMSNHSDTSGELSGRRWASVDLHWNGV
jgi:hypothetical protein